MHKLIKYVEDLKKKGKPAEAEFAREFTASIKNKKTTGSRRLLFKRYVKEKKLSFNDAEKIVHTINNIVVLERKSGEKIKYIPFIPENETVKKIKKAVSVPHKEVKKEAHKDPLKPKKAQKSKGKRPFKYGDYKLDKAILFKVSSHERDWLKEQGKGHRGGMAEFIRSKLGLHPVK